MKFGNIFETHKIPEWYEAYLNYKLLKKLVKNFKKGVKSGKHRKLNGIYRVNKKFVVYHSDLFDKKKTSKDKINNAAANTQMMNTDLGSEMIASQIEVPRHNSLNDNDF